MVAPGGYATGNLDPRKIEGKYVRYREFNRLKANLKSMYSK
jgi:hypothetical protein